MDINITDKIKYIGVDDTDIDVTGYEGGDPLPAAANEA